MKTNTILQQRIENRLIEIYGDKNFKFECFNVSVPLIHWYNTELFDIDIIMEITGDTKPDIYIEEDEEHGKYFCIVVTDKYENDFEIPF